jgi:hypothetical protein
MNKLTRQQKADLGDRLVAAFADAIHTIILTGRDPEPLRKSMAEFVAGVENGEGAV